MFKFGKGSYAKQGGLSKEKCLRGCKVEIVSRQSIRNSAQGQITYQNTLEELRNNSVLYWTGRGYLTLKAIFLGSRSCVQTKKIEKAICQMKCRTTVWQPE